VRTRKAAGEEADEEVDLDVPSSKACDLTSDMKFHRRLIVSKEENAPSSDIYALRHPRSVTKALYQISSETSVVNEVLLVDDPQRSTFYGESVISDGSITILSPVHALFIAIPYLLKHAKGRFVQLVDCLQDEDFSAISLLIENKALLRSLELVTEFKVIADEIRVFRYDDSRLLEWLEKRFEVLKKALVEYGHLHKSITDDEEVLRRYTFGVLSDYLPEEISKTLKTALKIRDPEITLETSNPAKRKALASADNSLDMPLKKKPPQMTTAQKKLQQASKGTKSLTSFFTTPKA
jgi:ribonuclease H2 subunit B